MPKHVVLEVFHKILKLQFAPYFQIPLQGYRYMWQILQVFPEVPF
jgi:hypothetical protein